MMDQPKTSDVLVTIGKAGVIVGSWATKRESAKDIDVVIRATDPTGMYARNPVIQRLLAAFGDYCESSIVGHLWINSIPQPVEIFESHGTLPPDDPAKHAGVLTYHQALRRSRWRDVHGVSMRVVD